MVTQLDERAHGSGKRWMSLIIVGCCLSISGTLCSFEPDNQSPFLEEAEGVQQLREIINNIVRPHPSFFCNPWFDLEKTVFIPSFCAP